MYQRKLIFALRPRALYGLSRRPPHRYHRLMTKTVGQLRAEATEYRELAETFEGASMQQALLETATALERLADDQEADPDFSRRI